MYRFSLITLCIITVLLSSCQSGNSPQSKTKPLATKAVPKTNTAAVNWLTIEDAEKKMAVEPRDIYVMVYASWCTHCQNFDKTTYRHPKVIKDLNEKFYPVKINAHDTRPMTYKGKSYSNPDYDTSKSKDQKNTFHEILYEIQAKSVPSIVFINETFELTGSLMGFKEADELRSLMHMYRSK